MLALIEGVKIVSFPYLDVHVLFDREDTNRCERIWNIVVVTNGVVLLDFEDTVVREQSISDSTNDLDKHTFLVVENRNKVEPHNLDKVVRHGRF